MPQAFRDDVTSDPRVLVGRWRLTRRLADRRAGGAGVLDGFLDLSPDDAGQLRWRETGLLTWDGRVTTAERDYLLRLTSDGWWVCFDDGRPFHRWTPGTPVEHLCVADTYRGLVRVDGPDAWRIAWRVTGPAKDQRIVSRLSRCPAAP